MTSDVDRPDLPDWSDLGGQVLAARPIRDHGLVITPHYRGGLDQYSAWHRFTERLRGVVSQNRAAVAKASHRTDVLNQH